MIDESDDCGYCDICGYEWSPEPRPRYCPRCDYPTDNNQPDGANMSERLEIATGAATDSESWECALRYAEEHAGEFEQPLEPTMHPYHCVICGSQLVELGLGVLGCPTCAKQFIATTNYRETEFSLTWS